jgi:N utilization substance protein B
MKCYKARLKRVAVVYQSLIRTDFLGLLLYMKERRLAREVAMQILFQWEAQGQLMRYHNEQPEHFKKVDIESFVNHFWTLFYNKDHKKIDHIFAAHLISGTIKYIVYIDQIIDKTSTKWKLSRMDAIERAILRLATFELLKDKVLAPSIIINEAIELAKRYGNEQSSQFINGILDSLK